MFDLFSAVMYIGAFAGNQNMAAYIICTLLGLLGALLAWVHVFDDNMRKKVYTKPGRVAPAPPRRPIDRHMEEQLSEDDGQNGRDMEEGGEDGDDFEESEGDNEQDRDFERLVQGDDEQLLEEESAEAVDNDAALEEDAVDDANPEDNDANLEEEGASGRRRRGRVEPEQGGVRSGGRRPHARAGRGGDSWMDERPPAERRVKPVAGSHHSRVGTRPPIVERTRRRAGGATASTHHRRGEVEDSGDEGAYDPVMANLQAQLKATSSWGLMASSVRFVLGIFQMIIHAVALIAIFS